MMQRPGLVGPLQQAGSAGTQPQLGKGSVAARGGTAGPAAAKGWL